MDNQDKIENLVDELYVLHKDAGERMVELTKENKETLNEMQRSQRKMREFVEEKVAQEQRWNMRFMCVLAVMFVLMVAIISYVIFSFRSEVSYSIEELADTGREANGVMARLYLEQKKFIEENKCATKEIKKSTEANKKSKGK